MERLLQLLSQDVVAASPALLGCILVHGQMRARIVEVEAYRGVDDPACHAFGKTRMKNMVMFGPPGHAYVYLNYGMHWMLNVVAHAPGDAAAILIRAAEPLAGLQEMRQNRPTRRDQDLLSGPGKLTQAFGIAAAHNGRDLLSGEALRIEPGEPPATVLTGPRIGIREGKWHDVPWRFLDGDRLEWASRPLPAKK
jgi:DNA-3-methyladenine glycosylase